MHGPINVKFREGTAVICLKDQAQPCKILVSGKLVQWDLCVSALYESDTKHLINMNKAETSTYAGAALLRRVHKITKKKRLLVSSCLSFRSSAWNISAPSGRIFMKSYIWVFFEHLSRKLDFSLKSDKNNGHLT